MPGVKANVATAIAMGFLFSYFDHGVQKATSYQFMSDPLPWIMLFALFGLPFIILNGRRILYGLGSAALGLSVEDMGYWLWARQLPTSWAPYYPVYAHVPVMDVIGLGAALMFYGIGSLIYR